MSMKKIYFDMDGVLADFKRGVKELAGFQMTGADQDAVMRDEDDAMWEAISSVEHFYDRLEPLPNGIEMFRFAQENYPGIVEVLTGIPKPKRGIINAGEDKISWVKRILGEDIPVHIVFKEDKKNYCKGKDYILIDDRRTNIEEWEEAGGTGILYKEPRRTKEKLAFLEDYLNNKGKYLPLPDRTWRIAGTVDEDGAFNLGWDVGLIGTNRPFLAEYWSDGVRMLTFFVSTEGIEDYSEEQLYKMIVDAGLVWYFEKPDHNGNCTDKIKDKSGNEFYSINILAGEDDGNFIWFEIESDYSSLNDFNRSHQHG